MGHSMASITSSFSSDLLEEPLFPDWEGHQEAKGGVLALMYEIPLALCDKIFFRETQLFLIWHMKNGSLLFLEVSVKFQEKQSLVQREKEKKERDSIC